ncbi:MAG: helix-turn-helix domain-containing protein [Chitinophagaceae bacterium]
MDKNNIQSVLSLIIVFISLLFTLFLFTVKSTKKLSNILLALFIFFNAVDISSWFLDRHLLPWLDLLMFKHSLGWLINPLFYLYALSICYADFKLRPKHLLHLIPFLLANLVLLFEFYTVDHPAKLVFLEHYSEHPEIIFMNIAGHLQFVFYIAAVFLLLSRYRKIYLENYTDAGSITYRWLFQLTTVITIVHSIVLIKDIINQVYTTSAFENAQLIVGINAMLVVCWFVMKALYNPELFRSVDSAIQPVENIIAETVPPVTDEAYATGDTQDERIEQLKSYMVQQEPFLDPALTIQQLAAGMKMPVRDLSVLINHQLGQHFFDFVNEYRIRKAMALLKDPQKNDLTIQEIFYEVGFNSKSSFNTAFKKHAGVTPTQFRTAS